MLKKLKIQSVQAINSAKSINRVLTEEANAILEFADNTESCVLAAQLIFNSSAPLVVAGIGKSGHIASKIASTFRSLGKPAIFLHAAEASHGDLSLIQAGSVVMVLSKSGETTELSDILQYCKQNEIKIIGLTGFSQSTLAIASDIAIVYGDVEEACHNGLAPTTSTTLSLAIGDALAVAVSEMQGNQPEDFKRFHPGGKLGSRLATVQEIMRVGDALPVICASSNMNEVVIRMSEMALGVVLLMDNQKIQGIITDGDLRRNIDDLLSRMPIDIATRPPQKIHRETLVREAVDFMSEHNIFCCVIEDDDDNLLGLLHIHDCVRSGFSR